MNWKEIPALVKFLGTLISALAVGILSSILWMFSTFVTQAQDQQQWQFHQQAVTCNRVSELRLAIEQLRWELKNPDLPQYLREQKNSQIESLEKEIARLDPRGICG